MADAIGVSTATISIFLLRLNLGNFNSFISKIRCCIRRDSTNFESKN